MATVKIKQVGCYPHRSIVASLVMPAQYRTVLAWTGREIESFYVKWPKTLFVVKFGQRDTGPYPFALKVFVKPWLFWRTIDLPQISNHGYVCLGFSFPFKMADDGSYETTALETINFFWNSKFHSLNPKSFNKLKCGQLPISPFSCRLDPFELYWN